MAAFLTTQIESLQKRSLFLSDRPTVRVQRVAIAISVATPTPNKSFYLALTKSPTQNLAPLIARDDIAFDSRCDTLSLDDLST